MLTEELAQTIEITDEIRKEYFIDYGIMNGWGEEKEAKHRIAYILHERDQKENPHLHNKKSFYPYNCYEVVTCKCNYKFSVDSSG
jgi:hypothetical protein